MGYREPTPIQAIVIPEVQAGHDVVGQAQTGTGKTAAFGIPLVEDVSRDVRFVQALVLVPTRELSVQVSEEIARLGRFRGLRVIAIYGGQSINRQLDELRKGVHIIVATPGRLIDHLERGTVRLSKVRFVVLDEADQILDIGFADDIRKIFRYVPASRRTLLFSATMPSSIKGLVYRYMKDPVWITVGGEAEPVDQVKQVYFEVAERDRYSALDHLLKQPNEIKQALVFRRTKTGVDRLVNFLKNHSHDVQAIHGDIPQPQRDAVMSRFRAKKLRVLVATNVASRGLDIPAVSHVINYDMPGSLEEYIHRIGRTARMGKPGTAITFVSEWDFEMLDVVQSHVGGELKNEHLLSYLSASSTT
jgi:ATP-dependent RNA helicase DeaD